MFGEIFEGNVRTWQWGISNRYKLSFWNDSNTHVVRLQMAANRVWNSVGDAKQALDFE
jgi:hypothetical protein